jgi:hypothetical protein
LTTRIYLMHLVEKAAVRHSSLAHSFHPPSSPILGADSTLLAFLQIDELHTSSRRRRCRRRARASGHVHVNATFHFFFPPQASSSAAFLPGPPTPHHLAATLYTLHTHAAQHLMYFLHIWIFTLWGERARRRERERRTHKNTKNSRLLDTHPPTSPAHTHTSALCSCHFSDLDGKKSCCQGSTLM